ncbi:MAG: A/G-specific adenine glycosylase [Myxococcales bacterium]|nr:A/G-specific adenine glycosylase [Myxococcales bacterium]
MPAWRVRVAGLVAHADEFVRALGAWYDAAARPLPWRATRDPYAVWVSEVMLQQTRVETVVPYYGRFLARFPTAAALGAAPLEEVLAAWSGLGYYRRARALWLAAREVCERWRGRLPGSAAELATLSGVGPYTAGAVASIAFDAQEPLVDGNVARVLSRLAAIDEPTAAGAGRRALWELARALVPARAPGRFNQALMELGATLCTPARPACGRCPVASLCAARALGSPEALPVAASRRASERVDLVAAVAFAGAEVWLGQRALGGLYAGLWEPPMVAARSLRGARSALRGCGLPATLRFRACGELEHVLTHRRLALRVVVARTRCAGAVAASPGAPPYAAFAWQSRAALPRAMSTLARRVLALAETAEGAA